MADKHDAALAAGGAGGGKAHAADHHDEVPHQTPTHPIKTTALNASLHPATPGAPLGPEMTTPSPGTVTGMEPTDRPKTKVLNLLPQSDSDTKLEPQDTDFKLTSCSSDFKYADEQPTVFERVHVALRPAVTKMQNFKMVIQEDEDLKKLSEDKIAPVSRALEKDVKKKKKTKRRKKKDKENSDSKSTEKTTSEDTITGEFEEGGAEKKLKKKKSREKVRGSKEPLSREGVRLSREGLNLSREHVRQQPREKEPLTQPTQTPRNMSKESVKIYRSREHLSKPPREQTKDNSTPRKVQVQTSKELVSKGSCESVGQNSGKQCVKSKRKQNNNPFKKSERKKENKERDKSEKSVHDEFKKKFMNVFRIKPAHRQL